MSYLITATQYDALLAIVNDKSRQSTAMRAALELEVQGEVDKFEASAMLLGRQCSGRVPDFLSDRLFQDVGFLPTLEHKRRVRYERANDYAGRFCAGLERRHMRACSGAAMTRELRHFYRLNQGQKLRHIDAART